MMRTYATLIALSMLCGLLMLRRLSTLALVLALPLAISFSASAELWFKNAGSLSPGPGSVSPEAVAVSADGSVIVGQVTSTVGGGLRGVSLGAYRHLQPRQHRT